MAPGATMKSELLLGWIAGAVQTAGWGAAFAVCAALAAPASALAQRGQPAPWQLTMQDPVTPVARNVYWFHDVVNAIIVAIAVFVLILLAIVVIRFNERSNPTPSRITHNPLLEVMWTVIPVVIL